MTEEASSSNPLIKMVDIRLWVPLQAILEQLEYISPEIYDVSLILILFILSSSISELGNGVTVVEFGAILKLKRCYFFFLLKLFIYLFKTTIKSIF
jgi:hypothetical protein